MLIDHLSVHSFMSTFQSILSYPKIIICLYFAKFYNIPKMINDVGSAKKAQSTFEILGKMA